MTAEFDAQDEFLNGPPRLARSRGGRPIIRRPDGTLDSYTRASSLGRILDDETALVAWKLRQAIIGVCSRKQFVVAVNAHCLDKDKIDEIIEMGLEAAGASDAATAGTAVHELCDRFDRLRAQQAVSTPLSRSQSDARSSGVGGAARTASGRLSTAGTLSGPYVDEDYREGVESYLWATQGLEVLVSEEFGVCDELGVGGTPDRIYRLRGNLTMPDDSVLRAGTLCIGDVKCARTLDYGEIDFGVQLACYAHSARYDISGGETASWRKRSVPVGVRTPWVVNQATGEAEEINKDWALIVWIPGGTGTAQLRPVDIRLGWELAGIAEMVRRTRSAAKNKVIHGPVRVHEDFGRTVGLATSLDELMAAHHRAVAAETWDDDLKSIFAARRREIQNDEPARRRA